jgi:hypothetical protein
VSNLLRDKDKINFIKHKYFGIDNAIKEIYKFFNLNFENQNFSEILAKIFDSFVENLDLSQLTIFAQELGKSSGKNDLKYHENIKNFINKPKIENLIFLHKGFLPKKIRHANLVKKLMKFLVMK